MEKKKRNRDVLRSFNPGSNMANSEAKKEYRPAMQLRKSLNQVQITAARRKLNENGLNEKRRRVTPEDFSFLESETTLDTTTIATNLYEY